jgi:hypothetical protein
LHLFGCQKKTTFDLPNSAAKPGEIHVEPRALSVRLPVSLLIIKIPNWKMWKPLAFTSVYQCLPFSYQSNLGFFMIFPPSTCGKDRSHKLWTFPGACLSLFDELLVWNSRPTLSDLQTTLGGRNRAGFFTMPSFYQLPGLP